MIYSESDIFAGEGDPASRMDELAYHAVLNYGVDRDTAEAVVLCGMNMHNLIEVENFEQAGVTRDQKWSLIGGSKVLEGLSAAAGEILSYDENGNCLDARARGIGVTLSEAIRVEERVSGEEFVDRSNAFWAGELKA